MNGAQRRAKRFFDPKSGRAVLLTLDQGVSDGMIQGMPRIPEVLEMAGEKGVQGIILNKGMSRAYGQLLSPSVQLVTQLSGGTRHGLPPYAKTLVCSVAEALRLGADAVSIQVNIGNDLEDRMLADFGVAVDEAHQLGAPVIATIAARGGQIVNERDPSLIAHCIRLGAELGADIICVPFPGAAEGFGQAAAASPVPVLALAGPASGDFAAVLSLVRSALDAGAAGVSIGRAVLLQPKPAKALAELLNVTHNNSRDK
jgi:class I fructose-bisphosphate aldolase